MIYMDYNATAPMKAAVKTTVQLVMERCGNPSSVHSFGREVRKFVEQAREKVATLVGVRPSQVVFTSGATEANNMVLRGAGRKDIFVSAIEHDSVLATAPQAKIFRVLPNGLIDMVQVDKMLKSAAYPGLVSVMLANNETGVIQPVREIALMAKEHGHLVHTDAVQAVGRIPIQFNDLNVDYMSISSHKIGGPHGVGALILSEKATFESLTTGGGQEMRRRAGTENVAGIAGFGVAAELAMSDLHAMSRLASMRDTLEAELNAGSNAGAFFFGREAPRLANTICVAMPGVKSETQIMSMDMEGIAVSAGSACSSGKVKASHVLKAMGYDEALAGSAMRISLGWNSQALDIDRCAAAWIDLFRRTRNQSQTKVA
jgi:cysteine desulfurase